MRGKDLVSNKDKEGIVPNLWECTESVWHIGWEHLDDDRYIICFLDNLTEAIKGYDIFDKPTIKNLRLILEKIIKEYGKPEAITIYHSIPHYANKSKFEKKEYMEFKKDLEKQNIKDYSSGIHDKNSRDNRIKVFFEEMLDTHRTYHIDIPDIIEIYNKVLLGETPNLEEYMPVDNFGSKKSKPKAKQTRKKSNVKS
jgi:hypothetical protein